MNLAKALGLAPGESAAFVGAGGKTSTMFALAEDLKTPVILTTTTHLGAWQAGLADVHVVINNPDDIHGELFSKGEKILITEPPGEDDRLHGLQREALEKLQVLCLVKKLNLLIEADGARLRAVKAPADYEPVIPPFVDYVIVLAGLSALGKPLDSTVVHRPELFKKLTGLVEGDCIREEDLVKLLRSPQGGLKGIPSGVRKIAFLNQADDEIKASKGGRIARQLVDAYDRVLVGSIEHPTPRGPIHSVFSQTAGVILAAGGSERLKTPKQLLDWRGKPFIRHIAESALEAGLRPLIIITGAYADQVQMAVDGLPVKIVYNPDWEQGQSTSVKLGLQSLPPDSDSVMFLLSDQPQISADLIQQLLERYAQRRFPITAPMVEVQRANPMVFNRETFKAFEGIVGDRGGRAILNQFDVDWLPCLDRRILLDVDREGDYERLLKAYSIFE